MKKIDFHVHIQNDIPYEQTVGYYTSMMKENGYCGVGIMALPYNPGKSNTDALTVKKMMPGSYAFASLDYTNGVPYDKQLKAILNEAFDGVKLLIGKPNQIKKFAQKPDEEIFFKFYELAEKLQVPINMHSGDPDISYDITKATPRMIERGWVYDDTYCTKEDCHIQVGNIMKRFPNLKIALAHMGFFADELDRLSEMMDKYPNLYMDITPALPIYKDLSQTPEKSRKFFINYQDRIYYGTDADNLLIGEALAYNRKKVKIVSAFLEGTNTVQIEDYTVNPINLPESVFEKIYYKNILRFCGVPK